MKIKNDLITIKTGKKKYEFKNLILDSYLNLFVRSQIETEAILPEKTLSYCLIKFDEPLKFQSDSDIRVKDFDFQLFGKYEQSISQTQIIMNYLYNIKESDNINYLNKKVTAIGFSSNNTDESRVYAILDTSNYNVYINDKQDVAITRRDIITTEALFFSNSDKNVQAPAHLCPAGLPAIISSKWGEKPATSILYSVGFSSYIDYIGEEFLRNNDFTAEVENNELIIQGLDNYLQENISLFGNENLYAGDELFPIKAKYKYLILKYKIYQDVYTTLYDFKTIDTGYFYHQAIPLNKTGKLNLKIKYERG